jgi:hypothetical protein
MKMARKNKPTLDHSDIKRICNSIVWAVFIIAYACYPKAFWAVAFIILELLCVLIDGKVPPEINKIQL